MRGRGYLHLKADYRLRRSTTSSISPMSAYIHREIGWRSGRRRWYLSRRRARTTAYGRIAGWFRFHDGPHTIAARKFAGAVDRWQLIKWQAPSTVTLDIERRADAWTPVPLRATGLAISMWSNHIITLETEDSTHYHRWCFARNYALDDPAVTEVLVKGMQTFMGGCRGAGGPARGDEEGRGASRRRREYRQRAAAVPPSIRRASRPSRPLAAE